jgi:23S rRNA (cytosine1962-C5)-methyltransferase
MSELPLAIIKSGREKSLIRRHPWIYSGAIKQIMGDPAPGATIVVMDKNNVRFGSGAYSPSSQIAIRMWSFQPSENIDKIFFRTGIEKAVRAREIMADASGSHMQRMVFAESDNLPGLIVDRYEDYLVVQLLTAGSAAHGQLITNILQELFPEYNIFERSDDEVRKKEGLPLSKGVLAGKMPPDLLPVKEGEASYWIDMQHGHKTGFYLDQSDNRRQIKKFVAGQEVLNCFSYTGGFTVSALLAGAKKVTNIESSAPLLEILNQNLTLNRIDAERNENICGDVFQVLRQFRDTGSRKFDVIILDPPRFADSRRQISKAARGYKDINWLACRLIKPGGILITFSCSGAIRMDLFQKILADAARDADRPAQIIQHLAQAADHPVALHFPESGYLKGLICRIG